MTAKTHDKCGHGKTWAEDCPQCDAIWETERLRGLIKDADKAADFFESSPGMALDPRVVPDLYRTISRLAKLIAAQPGKQL